MNEYKAKLQELIEQMKIRNGINVEPGLSDDEIVAVNTAIGTTLPPDLETFLRLGIPTGFPDWRGDPQAAVRKGQQLVEDLFVFDTERNDFWHVSLGDRPTDIEEAKEVVLKHIRSLAPLIPMKGHRYMPSSPARAGNPVISFHGPSDTIYYGSSLYDYLTWEYIADARSIENRIETENPKIPYWGDLLFGQ